jgi:hypothetical protein
MLTFDVRRPQRIGDGNVWPYLPCKTKVWISDVARFPSFSRQSALSRCSLVRRKSGVHLKPAIQAYCPYRLANDLPHRIPVWKTNRTLQVFGEKHNQIRIAEKRTLASPALQPSPPTCATIKLSSARAAPFDLAD